MVRKDTIARLILIAADLEKIVEKLERQQGTGDTPPHREDTIN